MVRLFPAPIGPAVNTTQGRAPGEFGLCESGGRVLAGTRSSEASAVWFPTHEPPPHELLRRSRRSHLLSQCDTIWSCSASRSATYLQGARLG